MQTAIHSNVVPLESAAKRAFARLMSWNLDDIKQHALRDGLYTVEEIDAVEVELKKYLALCIGFPGQSFPTPRKLDAFWHECIIFTRNYAAMCDAVCGHFVHHQPFVGEVKADPNARRVMHAKYVLEFGEEPNTMWGRSADCDGCCGSVRAKHQAADCSEGDIKTAAQCCNGCAHISAADANDASKCCSHCCADGGDITAAAAICCSDGCSHITASALCSSDCCSHVGATAKA